MLPFFPMGAINNNNKVNAFSKEHTLCFGSCIRNVHLLLYNDNR